MLINGRRLLPGDPTQRPAADINVIPAAMVDRVDVLTGGASSVYGADAVAGVVNFIMDTEFEGIRLDSQYSFYQHENGADDHDHQRARRAATSAIPTGNVADGGTYDISLAFGAGFDDGRGHVMAYAGYRKHRRRSSRASATTAPARLTRADRRPDRRQLTDPAAARRPRRRLGHRVRPTATVFTNFTATFFQVGPNRTFIPGFTPYNFAPDQLLPASRRALHGRRCSPIMRSAGRSSRTSN